MGSPPVTALRAANLTRSLRLLHGQPAGVTRAELARALGCSRSTAAVLVEDLTRAEIVTEIPNSSGKPGRPSARLVSHPKAPVVIALEISVGATSLVEVPLGSAPKGLVHQSVESQDLAAVLSSARILLHERLRALNGRLAGVAIAVHAAVREDSGRVVAAPGFHGADLDIVEELAVPPDTAIHLDNVANSWASAEAMRGRLRDASSGLLIHSAVGVGGAFVVDTQPLRGFRNLAGEYGHLPLGTLDLLCRCGRRDCWETEVDQLALCRRAGITASPATSRTASSAVFRRAAAGDATAARAVTECATALGLGLGHLVTLHDPEVIVVADHAADLVAAAPNHVNEALERSTFAAPIPESLRVHSSELGVTAPLIGISDALFARLMAAPLELLA